MNTAEPTTDTTQSFAVPGLTRAQLLNGAFGVRVRATRGNTTTAFTTSLDAVSVRVDYTVPGTLTLTSDAAGNLTARGADTFTYDGANRLTSATLAGATETYAYDGDGVRVSRQIGSGPPIRYVTDPTAGLPVTIADDTRRYVYGLGLAYAVNGSSIEVYHTDRLGSVRALSDAAGAVSAIYRTDAWGVPTASPGTTGQPFGFTGEPRDATGLTYLRARYYDPSLGRFLSRDTWAGAGSAPLSLNRYSYVHNNPVTSSDPSGLAALGGDGLSGAGPKGKSKALSGGCDSLGFLPDYLTPNCAESELCRLDPFGCVLWADSSALAFASTRFISDVWHRNAIRHVVWQATLTSAMGADRAEEWGNAHEVGTKLPTDSQIDQHNSAVGRLIGSMLTALPGSDDLWALYLANEAWSRGWLWTRSEAREIIWSDGRPVE